MSTAMEFIKKLLKRAFTNLLFIFGLGLVLNIISWLVVRFQIRPTSDTVLLHYTIYYTDVKGPGYYLYAIPAIGLAICVFNIGLYIMLRRREVFAGNLLLGVAAAAQVFILLAILFLKSVILI
jgi:hypothetical protein